MSLAWRMVLFALLLLYFVTVTKGIQTTLTGPQGSFEARASADGSIVSYLIEPQSPAASRIRFTFTSLIVTSSQVYITEYVGSNNKVYLFECVQCGSEYASVDNAVYDSYMPPPFYSSTGSVTVTIQNVGTSNTPSHISLQYASVLDEQVDAMRNVTTTLKMGYAKVSPLLLSSGLFPNQTRQQWLVTSPTTSLLTFSFANFLFPSDCSISLKIFNMLKSGSSGVVNASSATLLFSACTTSDEPQRWVYSSTGYALIVLDSSNANSKQKLDFQITYDTNAALYHCGMWPQTNVLQDRTATILDGSLVTSKSSWIRLSESCSWLIDVSSVSTSDYITFIMRFVSIKQGGGVVVYDGNNATARVLWDSGQAFYADSKPGSSWTIPPPLVSSGPYMYIVFNTDTTSGIFFRGFRGEYYTNAGDSQGVGSGTSLLGMSSAIDISTPGNSTMYAQQLNYTWLIRPDPQRCAHSHYSVSSPICDVASTRITFVFSLVDLPLGGGDELVIYDGPVASSTATVIARFSSPAQPLQWFTTTKQNATMTFITNGDSIHKGNFKLSYFTDGPNYHCGFTTNPALLTAPSMVITDGSASAENVYLNQYCEWTLEPWDSWGVYLFFSRYSIVGGTLSIFKGPVSNGILLATIRDTPAIPAPLYLPYSSIGISLKTDANKATGRGFSATYFGLSSNRISQPGDGQILLYSSSMLSLKHVSTNNYIFPTSNFSWILNPSSSVGPIYFALSFLNLTDCSKAYLNIHDGDSLSSPLLARLCGETAGLASSTYKWIVTSGPSAVLNFVSDASQNNHGNFEISYYSDGPNSHCGFIVSPGVMKAPSMVFTDGSPANSTMYTNQDCEWLIQPEKVDSGALVFLELVYNDLRGGNMAVYSHGRSAGAGIKEELLWRCNGCQNIPKVVISRTGAMRVTYSSSSSVSGYGFKAVYWTINSTSHLDWQKTTNGSVLEMPPGFALTNTPDNHTASWKMGMTKWPATVIFSPRIIVNASSDGLNINGWVQDGRPALNSSFQSPVARSKALSCGFVIENVTSFLSNNQLVLADTQLAGSYVQSSYAYKDQTSGNDYWNEPKKVLSTSGVWRTGKGVTMDAPYRPAEVCKYVLTSGSEQSIVIKINAYQPGNSRLRIYTGLYGNDDKPPIVDTSIAPLDLTKTYLAPCGKSTIILESTQAGNVDHGLSFSYHLKNLDNGADCLDYIISLRPKVIYVDPFIPYYIAAGSLGACCLACIVGFYIRRYLRRHWPEAGYFSKLFRRVRTYRIVTPKHPRYTPRLDEFRNKFLPLGKCCVCQEEGVKVFKVEGCKHAVCIEDIKGYLGTALGDISMFPVKCPMHYEACGGLLEARTAKRVLNRVEYEKFLDFADRATYGEGMRCIFCNNFVNFPVEGAFSMVECPYCIQRFCMRCKKPWHFGARCPLDNVDDSLEAWKQDSGAQKCPSCHKLIEKDDPDTCNHMVHKITDGIPCIRDRTDFCYLCGEEVTSDYPHEEVRSPGINHFPDGVFQKCRAIVQREREAERDRLKKMRRMKNKKTALDREMSFGFGGTNGADSVTDEWESEQDSVVGEGDVFDQQWGMVIAVPSPTPAPVASSAASPVIVVPTAGPSAATVAARQRAMVVARTAARNTINVAGSPNVAATRTRASPPQRLSTPVRGSPARVVPTNGGR